MIDARPRRSVLYAPAANPAILAKAAGSGADALIFDLEDAVAPEAKPRARANLLEFFSTRDCGVRETVVRVNALDTGWCEDDVRAMARLPIDALLFPKISTDDDVLRADALLTAAGAPRELGLWCMIETPLAILNVQSIARTAGRPGARMNVWVMGTNDLAKELHASHSPAREPLLASLAIALLAARAYGLSILDGVHNDFRDTAGLAAACRQAAAMGYDGKTVIHPSQIPACNQAFSPTEDAVTQARAIIAAFDRPENRGKGVLQIDGRMVERLHADVARRTLAIAEAIDRLAGG